MGTPRCYEVEIALDLDSSGFRALPIDLSCGDILSRAETLHLPLQERM